MSELFPEVARRDDPDGKLSSCVEEVAIAGHENGCESLHSLRNDRLIIPVAESDAELWGSADDGGLRA